MKPHPVGETQYWARYQLFTMTLPFPGATKARCCAELFTCISSLNPVRCALYTHFAEGKPTTEITERVISREGVQGLQARSRVSRTLEPRPSPTHRGPSHPPEVRRLRAA